MYLETILKYFNNGEELMFNFTTQELHDYNQNNFILRWTGFISENTKDIVFNILLEILFWFIKNKSFNLLIFFIKK